MPLTAKSHKKTLWPLLELYEGDEDEDKAWEKWVEDRKKIRRKMEKLLHISHDEAKRLYHKFHRLGFNHEQHASNFCCRTLRQHGHASDHVPQKRVKKITQIHNFFVRLHI
eukprot:scaffold213984_cov30-Tisochrysis_lutea.AAC.2